MSKTRTQEHIFVETRVNFYRVNIMSILNNVTATLRTLFRDTGHTVMIIYIQYLTFFHPRLKLAGIYLNNHVLGKFSSQIIILSLHLLHRMNVMLDCICMIQSIWKKRMESDKIQNEKVLPTVELEPTTLRFLVRASTDWASCDGRNIYFKSDL